MVCSECWKTKFGLCVEPNEVENFQPIEKIEFYQKRKKENRLTLLCINFRWSFFSTHPQKLKFFHPGVQNFTTYWVLQISFRRKTIFSIFELYWSTHIHILDRKLSCRKFVNKNGLSTCLQTILNHSSWLIIKVGILAIFIHFTGMVEVFGWEIYHTIWPEGIYCTENRIRLMTSMYHSIKILTKLSDEFPHLINVNTQRYQNVYVYIICITFSITIHFLWKVYSLSR